MNPLLANYAHLKQRKLNMQNNEAYYIEMMKNTHQNETQNIYDHGVAVRDAYYKLNIEFFDKH